MKKLLILVLLCLPFVAEAQNTGIGTTNPLEFFSVGASSQFRVDASGNVVRIRDVQYSFPASQGSANTFLKNDGSGNLTWSAVTTGTISASGTPSASTFLRGDGSWASAGGGSSAGIVASTSVSVTPPATTNLATGTQIFTHTIATTGTYIISGFLSMSGSVSSVLHVRVNGTLYQSGGLAGALDNFNTMSVGCVAYLTAGTVITANVQTYTSTALTGRIDLAKL